ncbi:Mu transposase C-terminal domain-containing protein [Streptomyces flavotricini]|uniref:Mu transposase C-terminal domain-containing protein n=1 Tax=Streptomyces flavotricini TaxID=66888 RepID=UPI001E35A1C3|nr:Mu transposase C-terminal domain-containing protein [Streptomyces flavotricini]
MEAASEQTGMVSLGDRRESLRPVAVARLLERRAAGELSTAHVRLVAVSLGVSVRTVWRWLARAQKTGSPHPVRRARFEITDEVVNVLADCGGNVKRAHEELAGRARAAGGRPPGLSTLRDAIRRDLTPGLMAGLREGVPAARGFDPAFVRPGGVRNQAWEGDHKQAPLKVVMPDRSLARVWVTWFEDRATSMVMGWAVTAGSAHRGSVLAALRFSVLSCAPYGPAGGLPQLVRIDGGADFVSRIVRAAFGALDVPVTVVGSARLKGGVERLNRTAMSRFFADLPGYTRAPLLDHRTRQGQHDPLLSFEGFVGLLRDWVVEHNTGHGLARTGMTPLAAWQADTTPLREVRAEDLRAYMLEGDGRTRTITSHGVEFHGRSYMPEDGVGRVGTRVWVRWMPHHAHEIDLYTVSGNRYLGRAVLADEASEVERASVFRARDERDRRLRRALKGSAVRRRVRYEAVTEPVAPRPAEAMTRRQALAELEEAGPPAGRPRRASGPAYQPRNAPDPGWVVPGVRPGGSPADAGEEP